MADPSPVAQTFLGHEFLFKHTKIDGIVTVVDAKHIMQHFDAVQEGADINQTIQQVRVY